MTFNVIDPTITLPNETENIIPKTPIKHTFNVPPLPKT